MEKQTLLKADYLDILYANRNKSYGGYELRRKYPDRAKRATYIVLLAAGMLSSIPVIAAALSGNEHARKNDLFPGTPIVIKDINTSRPKDALPKPIVKPAQAAAIAPTVAVPVLKIVPTDKVTDDAPKPVDSLGDRVVGLNNNDGHADGVVADNGQLDGSGKIPLDNTPPAVDPPSDKPLISVSQMPEFNGDVTDYMNKHINYPEQARTAGEQGRAVVKFVVNEDGGIVDAEIAVSAKSRPLDNEALRVVSSMPKWKPGKQQGKAVRVYFSLPITFRLD